MSTYSAGPHYVSCDECGRDTPRFKDMARLMASIRGWDFDRPSESHRCPDCGGTGAITRENSALEVETLRGRIAEAIALHWDRHDAFDDRYICCGVCNQPAPCLTVQALLGDSND